MAFVYIYGVCVCLCVYMLSLGQFSLTLIFIAFSWVALYGLLRMPFYKHKNGILKTIGRAHNLLLTSIYRKSHAKLHIQEGNESHTIIFIGNR